MIDIHTHIIYDVDDGSDTIEESVAILKSASLSGVTDIILTPHYIEHNEYNKEKVLENYEALNREVEKQNINIKLHPGNEIAIYGNVSQILSEGVITTLANSRYVLIEFPMNVDVSYVLDTIYEMRIKGLIPIIAHPERYKFVQENIDYAKKWVEKGCLLHQ